MKNQILKIWTIIKNHKKKSVGVVIFVIILFFLFGGKSTNQDAKTFTVIRGPLESTVRVSGKVKSATDASLAFEKAGTVREVFKNAGDAVKKGDVLIALDARNDFAALEKARAVLKQKRAAFAILTGSSDDTGNTSISIDGQNATQNLSDSVTNGYTAIIGAYNTLYKVLAVNLDPFFSNDSGTSPSLTFSVSGTEKRITAYNQNNGVSYGESTVTSHLEEETEQGRVSAEFALNQTKKYIADGKKDGSVVFKNLVSTETNLENTQIFLVVLSDTLNNANIETDTLATYKATLDTARDSITSALDNVKKAKQTIQEKNLAYQKATHFLTSNTGTEVSADVAEQEGSVEEAEANVSGAEADYDHNFLRAPFDGILSTRDVDVGESVKAQEIIARVIEPAGLRVEAQIGEIDVPKLSVGAPAEIYFDAYGKDILFPAHVASIDPGEKDVEGVPTYRTVITLDAKDDRIRTGMTVNIEVVAGKKDSTLQIPARALISKIGKRFVLITKNGTSTEAEIETGLRGDEGMIEITSGLSEGDVIQIP